MNEISGGERALITGAASGIGLCASIEFAKAGCHLVLLDINQQGLLDAKERLREFGVRVETHAVDVSDRQRIEELAWQITKQDGNDVDILVNNAGIGFSGELSKTGIDTWRRLLDVNLWGALNCTYAFLPHMMKRKSGRIVNVSSGQAFFRMPTWGAYAVSKLAVGAFSEILHFELARHGISVTAVYPFMTDTPFYRDVAASTWAAKLSMRLLPLYGDSPEAVAKMLFDATNKGHRVARISIFNHLGNLAQAIPLVPTVLGKVTAAMLMGKGKK